MQESIIITKQGKLTGPTVAIFAGVHGNEKVGVMAIERMCQLEIERGTAHFVIANPEALEKNVRFVEANLNRRFLENNTGTALEDDLARNLMKLLDTCDGLLDLHACNEPDIEPFVICEELSLEFARAFDVKTISMGWKDFEAGSTDAYIDRRGKIGIGLECGSASQPEQYLEFAQEAIRVFLGKFSCITHTAQPRTDQKIIKIIGAIPMPESGITFRQNYKTFDLIKKGEVFATSANEEHVCREDALIIFPRPQAPVGAEACLMATLIS